MAWVLTCGIAAAAEPMRLELRAEADFDDAGRITALDWQGDSNTALQAALEPGLRSVVLQVGPEVAAWRTHLMARVRLDPDGSDLVPTIESLRAGPRVLGLRPARYPSAALRRRIGAYVLAHFVVTPQGSAADVRVEGDRDGIFHAAIEQALADWKFAPESRAGESLSSPMCVPFRFTVVGGTPATPEQEALRCAAHPARVWAPGQDPGFDEIAITARRGA